MFNIFNKTFKFASILRSSKTIKLTTVEKAIFLIVYNYRELLVKSKVEMSFAILLDNDNYLLEILYDTKGNSSNTDFHYKEIALRGNKINAKKAIILHTHPGASIKPSDIDIASVKLIKSFFAEWNINLLDSCITADSTKFYSMKKEGEVIIKDRCLDNIEFYNLYDKLSKSKLAKYIHDIFIPNDIVSELNIPIVIDKQNAITL